MLVLSRKLNEKIIIDGEIVVTVVKIDRNQVRIGIEAPRDITILRDELIEVEPREAGADPDSKPLSHNVAVTV